MFFQRIKTPGIAHMAYVLADDGVAAVVDPCRDIDRYLEILHDNGLTLRWVLETHRQEDFEMGGAALRRLTGAEIIACDHEFTAHADKPLTDGDETALTDRITVRSLHTPGHTPESMSYAVLLGEAPDRAWGVFTGDTMFIGDTGRTDLPDADRAAENAGLLYDSVHAKILPLGDQALVLPAHGSGSACGGNVADRDDSTIGIEKVTNAVATMSRDAFMRYKADEVLARPPYFRLMEEVNLKPGRPLEDVPVPWLSPHDFARESRNGVIIDVRDVEAWAGGHVPGSYSVWLNGVPRYGGWITADDARIYLIGADPGAVREARLSLGRIGRDGVKGALAGGFDDWRDAGLEIGKGGTMSVRELADRRNAVPVIDVREVSEFRDEGHIPGAHNVYVGDLENRLGELGLVKDAPVVVTCSVGHRGSLGASMLVRNGYTNVSNLLGGMTAWNKLDLPTEAGEKRTDTEAE